MKILLLVTLTFAAACSQKKTLCSGAGCSGGTIGEDPILAASDLTLVGIMNYDQIIRNYSTILALERPSSDKVNATAVRFYGENGFFGGNDSADLKGLKGSLPFSNKVSEFTAARQFAIQKAAYLACDTGIELDLAFFEAGNPFAGSRRVIPNLLMTGLKEFPTRTEKAAFIQHLIDLAWMTNVTWTPGPDGATDILVSLFDDLASTLPKNDANAEKIVLKAVCSAVLASTPTLLL